MKKDSHPAYQEVLFVDSSTGYKFVCGSTLQSKEIEEFEGKKYPMYRLAVSSASHPFFTKANQFLDTEGRVDKFTKKYAKKKEQIEKDKEKDKEKEEESKKQKEAVKTKKKLNVGKSK
ncbi:MAG: type B 50S ribosomal protein L31 [Chlamydiota bacterium]